MSEARVTTVGFHRTKAPSVDDHVAADVGGGSGRRGRVTFVDVAVTGGVLDGTAGQLLVHDDCAAEKIVTAAVIVNAVDIRLRRLNYVIDNEKALEDSLLQIFVLGFCVQW